MAWSKLSTWVWSCQLHAAKRAHRHEADQLHQQLATATGEILLLRERVRSLQYREAGKPDGA